MLLAMELVKKQTEATHNHKVPPLIKETNFSSPWIHNPFPIPPHEPVLAPAPDLDCGNLLALDVEA